jgi:multisubunit Na+/H+ antiporter MnhG subunit
MQAVYAIRLAVFGELIKGTSPVTQYITPESETVYCELLAISLLGVFVVLLCVFVVLCVLLFLLQMPDCWLEVSIRKVLRTATSTQVFLGFPLSTSECPDGSHVSKLLLHACHVALLTPIP